MPARFPRTRPRHVRVVAAAAGLALWWLSAAAEYQYRYSGNAFTLVTQLSTWEPGDPAQGRSFSEQVLSAVLYTDRPLVAGATLADVGRLTMTLAPALGDAGGDPLRIDFPFVPQGPVDPTCQNCPGNPGIDADVRIGAVDAQGLPTLWSVVIQYHVVYPTGRHTDLTFSSTSGGDSFSGIVEPFVTYAVEGSGVPGTWLLAVPVPEPPAGLLMSVGLGLATWVAGTRCRRRP